MSSSTLVAQLMDVGDLGRLFDEDAEQLRHWYNRLTEINIGELNTRDEVAIVANTAKLIMQYEHANAEELKELAEREAVEAAEREENWMMEREVLKEEISILRDRITSKAGFDDTNEAFRAEIDSLTSENALLRQQARERDRELADQRDRAEELSTRLQTVERERTLFASNQSELEEQIRELNRRLNVRSDVQPQRSDWETRRLRQRNEQAVALSNQLQSVIAQNDELKAETERLTTALENATALIQEQNAKFSDYTQQLGDADALIEQLKADNRELRTQLAQKDARLTHSFDQAKANDRVLAEATSAKDAELESLRAELERRELEIEELRARLHLEHNEIREQEIQNLREELVAATQKARQIFGAVMSTSHGSAAENSAMVADPTAELRIRIIELDKKLRVACKKVEQLEEENLKQAKELEQKDLINVRINAENQRIRQMVFGDANEEILRLVRQLHYRDRQIQELNSYCSLLQIELHEHHDKIGKGSAKALVTTVVDEKHNKQISKKQSQNFTLKHHITFDSELGDQKEVEEEVHNNVSDELQSVSNPKEDGTEQKNDKAPMENNEALPMTSRKSMRAKKAAKSEVLKYAEIEPAIVLIDSLHREITCLKKELSQHQKDLAINQRLLKERGTLLRSAKHLNVERQREIDSLKAIIYSDKSLEEINAILAQNSTNADADELIAKKNDADIAKLRQHCDELRLENVELRRLAENIGSNGTEFQRRMAEATHRIVFLAIQNVRFERQLGSSELIRQSMAREHYNLRVRLQRVLSGEERHSRQLSAENEINLIEIARLQNILLHSVTFTEYRRVQSAYKKLLRSETINREEYSAIDGGYHSANGEDEESDSDLALFDISMSVLVAQDADGLLNRGTDELIARNKRLSEENDVQRSQCEFWQNEIRKKDAELQEMNAFIADIENGTEFKSMLVNIERRFIRMVRENMENAQEYMVYRREAETLRKSMQKKHLEWREERQALVKLALHLRDLLRKIRTDRVTVSTSELDTMKRTIDAAKQQERLAKDRTNQLERELMELEKQRILFEASNAAHDAIVNGDYQLHSIQVSLQSTQLSLLTLGAEISRTKKQVEKWQKLATEHEKRAMRLEKELSDFNFGTIDLHFLEQCQRDHAKSVVEDRNKSSEHPVVIDHSSDDSEVPCILQDDAPARTTSTVLIDNSVEYQRQINALQNAAKLCITTYEEQLQQKDRTIDEYRQLLDNVKREHSSPPKVMAQSPMENARHSVMPERPPTSAQIILDAQNIVEQSERRVHTLERELRSLKAANSTLTDRVEEAERRADQLNAHQCETRDKAVQIQLQEHNSITTGILDKSGKTTSTHRVKKALSSASEQSSTSVSAAASDKEATEAESAESETDSGTVDDIDGSSASNASSHTDASDKIKTNGTLEAAANIRANIPATESLNTGKPFAGEKECTLNHPAPESRRLKMRIIALERKIKQLLEENKTMRDRPARTRPVDSNAELSLTQKQKERLHGENRKLAKALQDRAEEIEALQKRLKITESFDPTKLTTDIWEERKKHKRVTDALKKRISELETTEHELQNLLARREKFIEQLTRDGANRHNETQKLASLQNEWRTERAATAAREQSLRDEMSEWIEKYRAAGTRLDMSLKENKLLHGKYSSLQEEILRLKRIDSSIPPSVKRCNVATQTYQEKLLPYRKQTKELFIRDQITSAKPAVTDDQTKIDSTTKAYETIDVEAHDVDIYSTNAQIQYETVIPSEMIPGTVITKVQSSPRNEAKCQHSPTIEALTKRMRKAELLQAETAEQLNSVNRAYNELLSSYRSVLCTNLERKREGDNIESTAVAVLRDKLIGKDTEIEHQRHKIVELEKRLWNLQIGC